MKSTNAKYGENDIRLAPVLGWFPCHIVSCQINMSQKTGNIVYNPTVKIAKEINKEKKYPLYTITKNENDEYINTPVLDKDGNQKEDVPTHMIGREFRGEGIWLTPDPGNERWRNENYMRFADACGIKFPSKKLDNNVTVWDLQELEEEDIIGLPILARIAIRTYKNKDGETKKVVNAVEYTRWSKGKRMDILPETGVGEDGLPF